MWMSVNLHFSVNVKILEFLKNPQFRLRASGFSFVFKILRFPSQTDSQPGTNQVELGRVQGGKNVA